MLKKLIASTLFIGCFISVSSDCVATVERKSDDTNAYEKPMLPHSQENQVATSNTVSSDNKSTMSKPIKQYSSVPDRRTQSNVSVNKYTQHNK